MIFSSEGISANASARADERRRGEVLVQLEDPAIVEPEPLPNGIASLHDGVEGADARLVPVKQPAVHIDDQVAVAFVRRAEACEQPRTTFALARHSMECESFGNLSRRSLSCRQPWGERILRRVPPTR